MPPKAAASEQPSITAQTLSSLPSNFESLTCGDCRLARKDKENALYCFAEPARPGVGPSPYRAEMASHGASYLWLGMVRAQVSATTPACGAIVVRG